MLLPNQDLMCSLILVISLGTTTSVSFPLLENLKAPLVNAINTSNIRNYIDTEVKHIISNVTKEILGKFRNRVDECINDALEEVHTNLYGMKAKVTSGFQNFPKECNDLLLLEDGVYVIYPVDKANPVLVYCVIEDNKKWTVIQRRDINKAVDFYKGWYEYKFGFGNPMGEHWLGNENIHLISSNGRHQIRIKLEHSSGKKAYADYSIFSVGNEASKYVLNVTGYSGTAGDSMDNIGEVGKANGKRFSTKDKDNDPSIRDCANLLQGGWWYSDCEYAGINNRIDGGNYPRWSTFGSVDKSLMMITTIA